MTIRGLAIVLGMLIAAQLQAEGRDATTAELEEIKEAFSIEWLARSKVFDLKGYYVVSGQTKKSELHGFLYLGPYQVRKTLCVLQMYVIALPHTAEGFEASNRGRPYYTYWKRNSPETCKIDSRDEIPSPVKVEQGLPTTALEKIIYNADFLLDLARAHVDWKEVSDRFEFDDDVWRLSEVSLGIVRQPGLEWGYRARYVAENHRARGPIVSFSLTPNGFEIHGVGRWVR
ncbi:MAG: hypothetical protein IIB68_08740 [Proteobacteria bacterium]|nr:hypothetical protein [Pseudomonadota bacterium]